MSDPTRAPAPAEIALDTIRAAFPALARRHGGRPVAYFDGPGGTQVPETVIAAMSAYLRDHNANTHWRYPTSEETDALLAASRTALAHFLNCGADEVSFGANMTTIAFHLGRALARDWRPGDELIVTELDHHANADPWRHAARDRGLTVRTARIHPETAELDWDHFASLLSPRTRLVAIGAASNALGTINDIPRAARLARDAGALVFVDAVHYAPHALVDVQQLGCDFLACSAYKFYGPHIGLLYGRRDLIAGLDLPKLAPAPEAAPERLETGTQNHEGIVGAAAAVDFLASIGRVGAPSEPDSRRAALVRAFDRLHRRGERLFQRIWTGLAEIPGVRLYGRPPGQPRTPTVAFTVAGRDAGDVAAGLAAQGLFVSHGDFYASTVAERLRPGPGGFVRAGCACYTSEDEVERLIDATAGFGEQGRSEK